jgi:hypothetical protein
MSKINWSLVRAIVVMAALIFVLFNVKVSIAHDMNHPEFDEWYASQMQPDNPEYSCCGPADRYFCNNLHTRGGKNYCNLEDDGVVPGRTPHPVGMEIEIPDNKMMDGHKTRGNPTGRNVVFLTSGTVPSVFCFVLGSGI